MVDDEILFEKAYKDLPEAIRKSTTTERAKENLLNSISKMRDKIEKAFDITPLKEFGTNYAEFYRDGQGAVKKLLAEKQGQVAGAFYRQELGDIDLVWGNEKFGLQHILVERTRQWGEEKALKFISHLDENIQKGQIVEVEKGRIGIKTDLTTIILDKKDDNTFIVTAFRDSGNKKELESLNLVQSKTFTSKNAETTAKDSPVTSQNQQEIIPNSKGQSQGEKSTDFKNLFNQREKIKAELDELEKEFYVEKPANLDTPATKAKINFLSKKQKEKMDYKRYELTEKIKTLTNELNQSHEMLKMLKNLGASEQMSEAVLKNLLNPNATETPMKYRYKDYPKNERGELDFKNKLEALEYTAKMSAEIENNNFLKIARKKLEQGININPLKEFGTNYAEFYRDGQGAVKKLLAEKQGQVAGAFYRQDLGDIDLIWGKSSGANDKGAYGLAHIIDKHGDEFTKFGGETRDEQISNALSEIIAKGKILPHGTDKINIEYNGFLIGLNKGFYENGVRSGENRWVVTAYDDNLTKAEKTAKSAPADDFTSEPRLSQNSDETLPQNELKSQADESQILSAYDKNVLENAPKETIEAHLKSIEKDIDYLEKGLDFYKKNPEQDYNGEMVKFNEKLLTPKLQMQKAYKQRLDELNSLDLSYAPKANADEIQITLPKEKQTRFTMRQNAYKSLKEVEKTPLTNANDGRVAYLNKTGRQESLSDYAINESAKNGFDEAQHLATAQHLPTLFENAKFKETTRDLKNNDKNVKIHRYTANFLLDNEPAQAQITLKETIAGQHSGNKIYTLKLESVSRLSPAEPQNPREALSAINDPKSSGFGEPSTKPSEIVSKIQEKFKFGEKKAKDLYEWHKDSSPLTKNDDGTPKVFYHGSKAKFETFIPNPKSYGIWLTSDKDKAIPYYEKSRNELYSVFVKGKKFYIGDEKDIEKIGFLKEPYTPGAEKIFEKLKRAGYDGIDMSDKDILIVFDSNQIKSIDNAGSWTDSAGKITKEKPSDESARHSYFNAQSPNILHSNEILGGGLAGGTLNGLETDEDGNITGFDPAKFVAGFIAGAAGTKAVKLAMKNPNIRAKAERFVAQSGEFIKNELQNSDLPRHARRDLERIFGKALVNSLDSRKFIIAGENAIGANREKLAKAQVMSKKGIDEGEIWDKTGWYLDKDGKWKFEINPQGGEIKLKTMPDDFENVLLKDLLKDNELFKAYPHLKEMEVFFDNTPQSTWQGQFARDFLSGAEYININKAQIKNYDDFKSILYHEIQHAVQSKESFASGGNLDNGLYHYKNKLGEVEARNVQSRMSDLYKPDFKKYLREARKMYDESELSDEAIFNIWKKQNLDKYPHPKETIDVNYDEIITQDLPKTKEVNVLENLQKLKPETIDELREEWVMMTNAERGGYARDELEKAMREKAAVFENDLALKSIITQDLNAQNGVFYGVDKDKLKNLGIMSAENLEKGEKMLIDDFKNLILDENLRVDYKKIKTNAKPNIMPSAQFKNYDEFRTLFENVKGKFGYIQTPYKRVKVKMFKAYRHFKENTNNINRDNIKGGFFSTLQDPLFIVRGERAGQNEPSVYFFKPFLSRNSKGQDFVMGIFSIAVDYDGNLNFKTYYHDKRGNRLKSVIDDILKSKGEVVYVKSPNG